MRRFVARTRQGRGLRHATRELETALKGAERYCNDHPPPAVVRDVRTVIADRSRRWQAYRPDDDLDRMIADSQARLTAHRYRIDDMLVAVLTPVRQQAIRDRLQPPLWSIPAFPELRVGTAGPIGLRIEAQRAG